MRGACIQGRVAALHLDGETGDRLSQTASLPDQLCRAMSSLPGFLRRTFRSYDDSEDSGPSTAPESPSIPDRRTFRAGLRDELVAGDSKSTSADAKPSPSQQQPKSRSVGDDDSGLTPMTISKRHLRAVAFPPLPPTDENHTTDSDSAKTASTIQTADDKADSSPTPSNDPPITYRERQFDTMLNSSIVPIRELRKLSWNGVPAPLRPKVWKILLGYLPANSSRHETTYKRRRREYKDAIKQHYDIPDDSRTNTEQETLRQVLVDVPRTAPEVPLFHNDRIRRCLSRLLYIWAMRHPASSYVQGINDLATPLISVFLSGYFEGEDCLDGERMQDVTDSILEEVEADTYWCLTNLLAGIQDHYTSDQPGMQRMVMHLEELVSRIDADLAAHLKSTGIEFIQFAFKWMNCLLLREFKLSCVMRLWDTYLSEERGFEEFHVYVCASFLVHFSAELQQMGFDELFQFMQNMPTDDWGDRECEILLSSAFVLSTLFKGSEAHLNVVRD